MEVVHFEVGALLTVEGSRLEAAFADPGPGSTNGVVAGFAPLRSNTPFIVRRHFLITGVIPMPISPTEI